MKQNDLSYQYSFKKINENISLKCKVVFSQREKDMVFYASNNLVICYCLQTSFIVERFRVSNNKIRNFHISDNFIFALDNNNEFIKYDTEKKQIEKSFNLSKFISISKEQKFTHFKFSKYLNSFIIITENFDLIKIDYDLSEEGSFVKNVYESLEEEFRKKFEFNTNNKKVRFMDTDTIGKTLIFSINKNVYVMNLFNSQISIIEFQKPISAGLFLANTKFVIGDISGKIHFVSNFFEEKPFISSSHWHSHKITSLEKDKNNEYLYSGGEEGVVVVWNLKSEIKSFLPRLGSEIMTISFASFKTNLLALTLKENAIRFINLFDSSVVNEVSGISLNKYSGLNDFEKAFNIENFKKLKINKNKYIMILNEEIGKIQLLNTKTGKIVSNLNLILKNFVSKTEKEKVNLRKLRLAEVIKPDSNMMVTYDEIKISENIYGEPVPVQSNKNSFLNANLKFWKITDFSETNFTLELVSLAENPHNNESIRSMVSYESKLITYSDSIFKVWDLADEQRLNCVFMGSYRKEKINSVLFYVDKTDQSLKLLSLHKNRFLVKWDLKRKEIEKVYSFGNKFKASDAAEEKDVILSLEDSNQKSSNSSINRILLKGENSLVIFNIDSFYIIYENNFDDLNEFLNSEINKLGEADKGAIADNYKKNSYQLKIIKAELYSAQFTVNKDQKETRTYLRFLSKLNNSVYLVIKCQITKGLCEIENFFYVKRFYLRHIDFSSIRASDDDLSLIMINNNLDVLITKREFDNQLLKVKLKRNTVDEEETERDNYDIVNNFEFHKYDENKNKSKRIIEENTTKYDLMDVEMKSEEKYEKNESSADLMKNALQRLKLKKK